MGFFDSFGDFFAKIPQHLAAYNAQQRYGPNYEEVLANQRANIEHAETQRQQQIAQNQHQQWKWENEQADRPLQRQSLEDRTTLTGMQLDEQVQKNEDEDAFFAGFEEAGQANKNAKEAFNKGSATHKMDPASDVKPPGGREAYQQMKGKESFFDMRENIAESKVDATNAEFLASPEGQQHIEDSRARKTQNEQLTINLQKQRLKEMIENDTGGSPATRGKFREAQVKNFSSGMNNYKKMVDTIVEQKLGEEQAEISFKFQDDLMKAGGLEKVDPNWVQMRQSMMQQRMDQMKLELTKQTYIQGMMTTLPQYLISKVTKGEPLDQQESNMIGMWLYTAQGSGLQITQHDYKRFGSPELDAFMESLKEGYNANPPLIMKPGG